MIQVDRNICTMFNFFHECKFSPPHYLVLREIHEDGAMKSCSVKESKIIAQFLQPFNPCPCFVSSYRRQRFSLTCISWYWNFEIKHVVFVTTIVEKTWYNLFGEDFIFVPYKIKESFHYFGLLLFTNAVLHHQIHEWWYLNTDTCSAWFMIALVPVVGYSLNGMINL